MYNIEKLHKLYCEYIVRIITLNLTTTINLKVCSYDEWLNFDYLEKYYQNGECRFYSYKDNKLHLLKRENCETFNEWFKKL